MKRLVCIAITLLMLAACGWATELERLGDLEYGFRDNVGIDTCTAFWSQARNYRLINRANALIQDISRVKQIEIGLAMSPTCFRYQLPDSVAFNSVVWAYIIPYAEGGWIQKPHGLSYKPMKEFQKVKTGTESIYTVWGHTVYVNETPTKHDSLYLCVYQVASDLSDSTDVTEVPAGAKRELILQYAYFLAVRAQSRFDQAAREWEIFLTLFQLATGMDFREVEALSEEKP